MSPDHQPDDAIPPPPSGEAHLIAVCAWCEAVIGPAAPFAPPGVVTHGICSECVRRLQQELPELADPADDAPAG